MMNLSHRRAAPASQPAASEHLHAVSAASGARRPILFRDRGLSIALFGLVAAVAVWTLAIGTSGRDKHRESDPTSSDAGRVAGRLK